MNKELFWIFPFVAGIMSQVGGSGFKWLRRFGIPVGLCFILTASGIAPHIAIMCGISVCAAAHLPFTFFGDSLKTHWFNWIWIWIAGYLLGAGTVWISSSGFILAFVPSCAMGVFGSLSNIRATARFFPWKLCEAVFWVSAMYPFVFLALK